MRIVCSFKCNLYKNDSEMGVCYLERLLYTQITENMCLE